MDLHRCGDCQEEFCSFEEFLIHKLLIEKYKLTIEPSTRIPGLRLPKFVKTQVQTSENTNKATNDNGCLTIKTEVSPVAEDESAAATTVIADQTSEEGDTVGQEVDGESDDNVSVWSQTESLRIDESAPNKDSTASPQSSNLVETEPKQKFKAYCKACDRYYKNNVVLRVHEETVHSAARPHSCPWANCQQAFKTKGSLVRHTRTHTGERPFRCYVCSRAFHDSGSLCRHVKRHRKLHSNQPARRRPNQVQVFITRLEQNGESQSQSPDGIIS